MGAEPGGHWAHETQIGLLKNKSIKKVTDGQGAEKEVGEEVGDEKAEDERVSERGRARPTGIAVVGLLRQ